MMLSPGGRGVALVMQERVQEVAGQTDRLNSALRDTACNRVPDAGNLSQTSVTGNRR
jgi:hypothetical protein